MLTITVEICVLREKGAHTRGGHVMLVDATAPVSLLDDSLDVSYPDAHILETTQKRREGTYEEVNLHAIEKIKEPYYSLQDRHEHTNTSEKENYYGEI